MNKGIEGSQRGLTQRIREDMKPALGVTEPVAIALACAKARSLSDERPLQVRVRASSGIYKNAFTCGIPNTGETGNAFSAALGCLAGNEEKGLFVLDGITEQDVEDSRSFIAEGCVEILVDAIDSELYINALVETQNDICVAEIQHNHTNVCYLRKNGDVLLDTRDFPKAKTKDVPETLAGGITAFALADLFDYAQTVPLEEIEFIRSACDMNRELAEAAFQSDRCTVTKSLLKASQGKPITGNMEQTAVLWTVAAAEARVLGLNHPAMSITGSGNHGIICTLPLYAMYLEKEASEENLIRGTALSYLITMYIKAYSGKLSAFCGCAIAGGTGAACAAAMIQGGGMPAVERTLYNMTHSIVGMICQGGNHGCVMKMIAAVKTGYSAWNLGMDATYIHPRHGISGDTPEQTMRNIGYIADPGMAQTEKAIIDIFEKKQSL